MHLILKKARELEAKQEQKAVVDTEAQHAGAGKPYAIKPTEQMRTSPEANIGKHKESTKHCLLCKPAPTPARLVSNQTTTHHGKQPDTSELQRPRRTHSHASNPPITHQ